MKTFTNDLGLQIIKVIHGIDDYVLLSNSPKEHKVYYDKDGRAYIKHWCQKNYLDEFIADDILAD